MKFFKKVFVIFLLVFSSQQVLANNPSFNKSEDNFISQQIRKNKTKDEFIIQQMKEDYQSLIKEIEEISGISYENQNIFDYSQLVTEKMYNKVETLSAKFYYAMTELNKKEINKVLEKYQNLNLDDLKNLKKMITDLNENLNKIKPRNMREVELIQDIRNWNDIMLKAIKIQEMSFEFEKKYQKLYQFN